MNTERSKFFTKKVLANSVAKEKQLNVFFIGKNNHKENVFYVGTGIRQASQASKRSAYLHM